MEVHSTWVSDLGFRVHSSPSGSPRGLRDQITAVAGLDCLHLLVVLVSWLAGEIRAEGLACLPSGQAQKTCRGVNQTCVFPQAV